MDQPTNNHPWYKPFIQFLKALIELLAHVAILIAILGGIRLIEYMITVYWGPTEHLFFGRIPLSYIFHGADLALILGFVTYGVYAVMAAYIKK